MGTADRTKVSWAKAAKSSDPASEVETLHLGTVKRGLGATFSNIFLHINNGLSNPCKMWEWATSP